MSTGLQAGVFLAAALWGAAALAGDDPDLDLIPSGPQPPAQSAVTQNTYLEDAYTKVFQRDDLVVPLPASYDWQDRLLLDLRRDWQLRQDLRLVFSNRLNVRREPDLPFPDDEDVVTDFREAYISWQPTEQSYLDFGRINFKNGIALGYNPTDYFKTRAVSEPLSADPTVLREDRLGTAMLRLQEIWQQGTLTLAYAPRLHRTSAIYSNDDLPSFNPMFDRTNAHDRVLVKASCDFSDNFDPELLLYREDGRTQLGMNLSVTLGQSVVTYVEWSGAQRPNLITDALAYGRSTGTLPPGAPSVLPTTADKSFKSELALGASYTTTGNVTFNLEYHLNQAGFTATDWDHWFAAGAGQAAASPVAEELWYLRSYAQDQQQQNTEQMLFLRADWVDAFGLKLELSGFGVVDLHDHSGEIQAQADYYLSDAWTLGAQATRNFGGARSDFGSLPTSYSVLLSLRRYL